MLPLLIKFLHRSPTWGYPCPFRPPTAAWSYHAAFHELSRTYPTLQCASTTLAQEPTKPLALPVIRGTWLGQRVSRGSTPAGNRPLRWVICHIPSRVHRAALHQAWSLNTLRMAFTQRVGTG